MRTILGALALAAALPAAAAQAQDASAADEPTCRQVRPGHLECTEERVVGRTPSGFVLLGRSRTEWQPPPLVRRDATREVVRTVRREPF